MSAIKGDFISFTYNGVHSTELGIVRVTASNRYTDLLLPTIQDKTVPVPGNNGTYFFGTYYPARNITINIAYDSVTEAQLREMRRVFSADAPHELIFDDEPYKVYYAKITGTPQLQYIPFDSEDAIYSRRYINNLYTQTYYERVYKGEGTLTFTCFDPFAHCLNEYKYLDLYVYIKFNLNEFELGNIGDSNGLNSDTNELWRIRLKNYYTQSANTTLILNTNFKYFKIFFYKALGENKIFLEHTSWKESGSDFTTPNNTQYIRIVLSNNNSASNIPDEYKITVDDFSYTYMESTARPYWYSPTWILRAYSKQYKVGEWNLSAHLLNSKSGYDNDSNISLNQYTLYNPGNVETDFLLIMPFGYVDDITGITLNGITLQVDGSQISTNKVPQDDNSYSYHLCFDSKTNLVKLLKLPENGTKYIDTGYIYNEILGTNVWPKIPLTGSLYDNDINGYKPVKTKELIINLKGSIPSGWRRPTLKYDYLYY